MWRFILADFIETDELGPPIVDAMDTVQNVSTTSGSEIGANFMKMVLTFVLLIIFLYASYWAIKKLIQSRLQKGTSNSSIHILEKKMLSVKTMLYLVEVDNKRVLLAESHLNIKKIETLPIIESCDSEYQSSPLEH